MYESTFGNVTAQFQPLIEMAELNRKTLEKMTAVQTSYLTECINSSIQQVKTLSASDSPQRATELAFAMIKEFEAKLNGATEQNLSAISELRHAYSKLVNGSCSESYNRIFDLYNLKNSFSGSFFDTNLFSAPEAVSAAPAKKATVTKTPAKKAEAAKPVEASAETKPAVTQPKAAAKESAPVVEAKTAAPVVEAKAVAPVVEKSVAKPVVETPVAKSPAVKTPVVDTPVAKTPVAAVAAPAEVKAAPKAQVKRAAAKPAAKKSSVKASAKK